jgi:hypothetical protein
MLSDRSQEIAAHIGFLESMIASRHNCLPWYSPIVILSNGEIDILPIADLFSRMNTPIIKVGNLEVREVLDVYALWW